MSKYEPLWDFVRAKESDAFTLSFEEIKGIFGFPIDHSFLNFKKELLAYGYEVGKISLKQQTVQFLKKDKKE